MSLILYATISIAFGFVGLATIPGYNPSFDFGFALILLGLRSWRPNDRKV